MSELPVDPGSAGRRDLDPLIGRISIGKRDDDLENAVVVACGDVLGLGAFR